MTQSINNRVKNCKTIPWAELKTYEFNDLKDSKTRDISKLKNAIVNNGFCFPLYLWSGHRYVIDGNGRNLALSELESAGYSICDLPIVEIEAENKREAKKLVLQASSQHGQITTESFNLFVEELDLTDLEMQDLNLQVANLSIEPNEEEANQETEGDDEIPEFQKAPFVVRGDIFELKANGLKYRVGCLDSTSVDDIEKLMDGEKADLCYSDPPYGISIVNSSSKAGGGGTVKFGKVGGRKVVEAKNYLPVANDETTDCAKEFYQACIAFQIENFIIWGGNYFTDFLEPKSCWIVWNKLNTGDFADCELAWTSFDKSAKLYDWLWNGMSKEGSRVDELSSRVHPTQKPVGLHVKVFEDFNFRYIFDGFAGSGSTLIACIKTKRNCFTCDIEPAYTQVSIKRAVEFCQKNNISFELTLNGEPFSISKFSE